jgi:hypothetical protein
MLFSPMADCVSIHRTKYWALAKSPYLGCMRQALRAKGDFCWKVMVTIWPGHLFQVDALPGLPPQRTMGEHAQADVAIALGGD